MEAIGAVGISQAIAARLQAAEREQATIEAQLRVADASAAAPAALLDDAIGRYRRLVLNLRQVLEEKEDRARTRQMLAELLGPVMIGCDDDGKAWAEIKEPAGRLAVAVGGSMGLVAGAGFEPATFGL